MQQWGNAMKITKEQYDTIESFCCHNTSCKQCMIEYRGKKKGTCVLLSELCHGDDLDPKFFEMVRKNGDYLARQIKANPDIFKKVRKWFWPYATVE